VITQTISRFGVGDLTVLGLCLLGAWLPVWEVIVLCGLSYCNALLSQAVQTQTALRSNQ
jgi:hypothetical protein